MKKSIALKPLAAALLLSLVLFPLAPSKALAGEPTQQVKETVDEVINILNDKELKKPDKRKERSAKIREVVEKRFDFAEMAKRSLGIYWRQRTPEEQKDFVSLFSDLLEDTYIRKIERYEHEKVTYVGEMTQGPYATVKTVIITTKEVEIPVNYKIFKSGAKWEVYDIIVEGVSLVNNYRTQFYQIIGSGSYADLVKKLKAKVSEIH
jgi:phospholipid transport system substrate-binding protein